jgi:serine/threonine protein kinase
MRGQKPRVGRSASWTIIKSISEGGQAFVFRVQGSGEHEEGEYVLKQLKNPKLGARMEVERRALSALDHAAIPKLVDAGEHDQKPFIVMRHLGTPLDELVLEHRLHPEQALHVMRGICGALQHAHAQGIVHRDIKPNNVVVADDNRPTLIDWALGSIDGQASGVTDDTRLIGTAPFAAPECVPGVPVDIGPAADVYSLGKLLVYVLCGGQLIRHQGIDAALYDAIVTSAGFPARTLEFILYVARSAIALEPSKRLCIDSLSARLRDIESVLNEDTYLASRDSWVLTDTLGPRYNCAANVSHYQSITGRAIRVEPNHVGDLYLDELVLSIHPANRGVATVCLMWENTKKKDSPGIVFYTKHIAGQSVEGVQQSIIRVVPDHIRLPAGKRFWVAVMNAPNSGVTNWLIGERFSIANKCDAQAVRADLEDGEWRTRYTSGAVKGMKIIVRAS